MPIISVPPVEPVADNILAIPTPTKVPPISTLVKVSATHGFAGIGIISNNIVCRAIVIKVLAQKLLLTCE